MTTFSEVVITCQGCIEDQSELATHMGIGGCLYIREDINSDDISIIENEDQNHTDTIITISDIQSDSDIDHNVQHTRERIYITGYQIYDVLHIITRMYRNLKNSWSRML